MFSRTRLNSKTQYQLSRTPRNYYVKPRVQTNSFTLSAKRKKNIINLFPEQNHVQCNFPKQNISPQLLNEINMPFRHYGVSYHTYTAADDHHEWGVTPNLTEKYSDRNKLFIHRVPTRFNDKIAHAIVTMLRIPIDMFFAKRYGSRAVVLETIAGVPGMVGGMWLHLKSLRRFEPDSDHWIHELLDEARNERMHLMTFIHIAQPSTIERLFVMTAQAIFWNAYFILFLLSQDTAHRMVGYLEEEAIVSYTRYLKEIEEGKINNIPAPDIAKQYWQLSDDADLKELVKAVRADECGHRDRNYELSDTLVKRKGKEKKPKYEHGIEKT